MSSGSATGFDPATHLGSVTLRVSDLDAMVGFYSGGVGLEVIDRSADRVVLGSGGVVSVELLARPDLGPAPRGSAGLYHTAILFTERTDLAAAIYATATSTKGSFTGSADHLVSEAFYFDDPEGNGVELYWDRPRAQWRWTDGAIAMDSLPLDPNAYIRTHQADVDAPVAPLGARTTLGHVHLKVGTIDTAHAFYVGALGFDVTTAMGSSALFTSAGGYHHHVGMNVWESRGAPVMTESLGLERFTIVVPDAGELAATAARLDAAGRGYERTDGPRGDGVRTTDPWGTVVDVVADTNP